jgi:excisionase family DNA binding protein
MATAERYLSLQEVGDELGVSDQTVRRWVKAGELAAYKPGKEYRIKGSDLEEFLQTREVSPKVQSPLPEFGDGQRLSRFAEAIIAAAERWGEAVASTDMKDSKRLGIVDAALDLSDLISGTVREEDWDAIPNQERLAIVTTMEKLVEAAKLGLRHAEESKEARDQEEQANQVREQIREWTRQIERQRDTA